MVNVETNYKSAIDQAVEVKHVYDLVGFGVAKKFSAVDKQVKITLSEVSEGITTSLILANIVSTKERLQLIDDLMDTWYTVSGLAVVLGVMGELYQCSVSGHVVAHMGTDHVEYERNVPHSHYPVTKFANYFGRIHGMVSGIKLAAMAEYSKPEGITKNMTTVVSMLNSTFLLIAELATLMQVDLQLAAKAVVDSNYSKFTTDRDVADASCAKYVKMGVKTHYELRGRGGLEPNWYVLYSSEDQNVDGKSYPKGKYLKCISFKEPDYTGAAWDIPHAVSTENLAVILRARAGDTIMHIQSEHEANPAKCIVLNHSLDIVPENERTHVEVRTSDNRVLAELTRPGQYVILRGETVDEAVHVAETIPEVISVMRKEGRMALPAGFITIDGTITTYMEPETILVRTVLGLAITHDVKDGEELCSLRTLEGALM